MQEIEDIIADGGTRSVSSELDEGTPLLGGRTRSSSDWLKVVSIRYRSSRKCVSSRAALLILAWNIAVAFVSTLTLNPDIYFKLVNYFVVLCAYGCAAFLLCFFPLAGVLADLRYGRYKTVVSSLLLMMIAVAALIIISVILLPVYLVSYLVYDVKSIVLIIVLPAIACTVGLLVLLVLYVGLVGYVANVIQFGMDQLLDSPGEDRTLFIHWFVWTYYVSLVVEQIAANLAFQIYYNMNDGAYYNVVGYFLLLAIPLLVVVILVATLCLARYRRQWFLIEPGRFNPYKLVYRVTKFACQHKIPLRRSAFTYCEDEFPTGLDLGKEKYGGPFTTEQVEDVKTFYGILKVLFCFGVIFFLDFAANSVFPLFSLHIAPFYDQQHPIYNETLSELILVNNGLLSPLLIVICIPLYLCLLRPFISQYVPGMLKRMGLGMISILLSLMVSFTMDTIVHARDKTGHVQCFFTSDGYYGHTPLMSQFSTLVQITLSALAHMLMYNAVFEFICSQSPHSMKGLVMGVFYVTKGLNQTLATLFTLPFSLNSSNFHPSCGFYYYLTNIIIGLVAVLVYVFVAKGYRYRQRDEPSNIRHYAEEYYSYPDPHETVNDYQE